MSKELSIQTPMCRVTLRDGQEFLIKRSDRDVVEERMAERKPVRMEGVTVNSVLIDTIREVEVEDYTLRLTPQQRASLEEKKKFYLNRMGKSASDHHIEKWSQRLKDGFDIMID